VAAAFLQDGAPGRHNLCHVARNGPGMDRGNGMAGHLAQWQELATIQTDAAKLEHEKGANPAIPSQAQGRRSFCSFSGPVLDISASCALIRSGGDRDRDDLPQLPSPTTAAGWAISGSGMQANPMPSMQSRLPELANTLSHPRQVAQRASKSLQHLH
jgi:hypothetical protein